MNWIIGLAVFVFLLFLFMSSFGGCTYRVGGISTKDKDKYQILRSQYPNESYGCGGLGLCICN